MFTGIIAAVGRIAKVAPESSDPDAGVRLTIDAGGLPLDGVAIGDSIAIAGACMTVVVIDGSTLEFDVSRESLDHTTGLDAEGEVNLEKALRFGDRLDGHLVSGHVDGTGVVVRFAETGESWTLIVRAPLTLARFIALKGSIAVDGVSLTINAVDDHEQGCDFSINLIPHTVAVTTLKHLQVGDRVNLEIDTIARYVERMLGAGAVVHAPQEIIAAA
jgi:riboflavin synthase